MTPFTKLISPVAPLPESSIDTDIIFPARFLLIMEKTGLGKHLFHERRHGLEPDEDPFILDRSPFNKARILVTGSNFGVGSSREHAVWALADFGIRCVIAPSFGEIFYSNCFKNGVLPITLAGKEIEHVTEIARTGAPVTVDLEAQVIVLSGRESITFDVDPYRRRALLLGLDEIGEILTDDGDSIADFEERQRTETPWLFLEPAQFSSFDDINRVAEPAQKPA